MRRPNNEYQIGVFNDYERNGNNNFNTKFLHIYDALLDFSYQSITDNGKYFNKYNTLNRNLCYISEPSLEKNFDDFLKLSSDGYRILVGFTGIGKTTLLKNYFGIRGRNPFIDKKNRVIAYKSFHSERINSENTKKGISKIDTIISGYVSSIIECLVPNIDYEKIDWNEFGNYVKDNKGDVLNRSKKIPGYKYNMEKELKKLCKKDPFEYYSCLLKYIMKRYNAEKDMVLIFDNIESVNLKFHIPILEKIFAFNTCLSYNKDRDYYIKVIISMRGYTFRYNLFRQGEAYRIALEDVIIKNSIPNMMRLIKKRLEVIENNPEIMNKVETKNPSSWDVAKEELLYHINTLDIYYQNLLTSLTHANISRTAKLLFKIATNNRWLSNEKEQPVRGSFIVRSENYNIYNKEAVMKALIYGEDGVYIDYDDNILPNILHNHYDEMSHCELLGLYILRYYQKTNTANSGKTILYGNTRIKGKDAVDKIKESLCKTTDKSFDKRLHYMMKFLYKQGLLLHSIYEPEIINEKKSNHERTYDSDYGLYISSRARVILGLIEKSSIILEFYRDDFDTDFLHNNRLSTSLTQTERFIYNIKYLSYLLDIEMNYIEGSLENIEDYKSNFGTNFIISGLITGIMISFKKYYGNKQNDYYEAYTELEKLIKKCFNAEEKIKKEIYFDQSFKNIWYEIERTKEE